MNRAINILLQNITVDLVVSSIKDQIELELLGLKQTRDAMNLDGILAAGIV